MGTCAYCHNPLQDRASVCSKCKAPVAPAFQPPANGGQVPNAKGTKRLKVIGAAFLAVMILGAIGSVFGSSESPKSGGAKAQFVDKKEIQIDNGIVPNFVGFNAADSYAKAEELGFSTQPYSQDGEYIYEGDSSYEELFSRQIVCYQGILPGSSYTQYDELKLVIGTSCQIKAPVMLAGAYAATASSWTPAPPSGTNALDNDYLEGWVVAYGDKYRPNNVTLLTSYGEVGLRLALIEPITNWCQEETFPGQDPDLLAMTALQETIPVFTPVRAVLAAGRQDYEVFLHRLDERGDLTDGDEPINSVNELLVKTGYWIPDAFGVDESESKVDPLKRKWSITGPTYFEPAELVYLKRLVAAANSLRLDKENPLGLCVVAEKVYWDENYKDYYAELENDSNSSSGGAVITGGGGGCYVRGHYRAGNWVNGYYRNC